MRTIAAMLIAMLLATPAEAQRREPVIDMHIHAYGADNMDGASYVCAPFPAFLPMDPGKGGDGLPGYMKRMFEDPACPNRIAPAKDDADLRARTIAELRRNNVYAIAGGTVANVDRWIADDPVRLMPAISASGPDRLPPPDVLRKRHAEGKLKALMELTFQYRGIAPDDPRMEPYWSLAEALDIPVGIHMGPGPPGTTYFATPGYRAALSDPLLIEPVLVRHPKLRVFIVHAGFPMKDRTMALMAAHPQVYAEFGVLTALYRDSDIWPYLKAFVDAGFEDRILYGSDQMIWPQMIGISIDRIRKTTALTAAQKRKFLYDNAARFLRIDPAGTGVLGQSRWGAPSGK
ncbi:amidohydrolase family protein [Sphingomonas sp. Y38-1Y]|uniref:amidohydrolase family protein n=1 Tax=Sphingomonas sp. Y38-1Y TaxID=3078265 RepID=UPI0028E9479D|nr:amidohydrolase family protein [Sphingomonas sp. Y38-1Y]